MDDHFYISSKQKTWVFSNIFKGYKQGKLTWNGFISCLSWWMLSRFHFSFGITIWWNWNWKFLFVIETLPNIPMWISCSICVPFSILNHCMINQLKLSTIKTITAMCIIFYLERQQNLFDIVKLGFLN